MARPRVFVSSTYYDLRQVRSDLETFIKEIGYDPVLFERGQVPYGRDKKLEEYCYTEIEHCDIVIAVIGGRFGSASQRTPNSISQVELVAALKAGRQVYIFIEKSVFGEYRTYLVNKDNAGIKFHFADNPAIYDFIEKCEGLPNNNPIHTFESARDIVEVLREQWAGLFQRFLQEDSRKTEIAAVQDIGQTAKTLKELVDFLTKERREGDKAIRGILINNHPIFPRLAKLLGAQYRVFFTNREELNAWLEARGFTPVPTDAWDDENVEEWVEKSDTKPEVKLLKVPSSEFDSRGALRIPSSEWDENRVTMGVSANPASPPSGPDDIPF